MVFVFYVVSCDTTDSSFLELSEMFDDNEIGTVSHGFVEGVSPPLEEIDSSFRIYDTVKANWEGPGGDNVWIAMNLGARAPAKSVDDNDPERSGWYFQFNRKQAYYHDNKNQRIPDTDWIETIDEDSEWEVENDPCRQLLGESWRIPTAEEWNYFLMALTDNNITNGDILSEIFNSDLKLHASGGLSFMDGHLLFRGDVGSYWSSSQADQINSTHLFVSEEERDLFSINKAHGFPVRCILD